jgi:hypothetical protein
VAVLAIIGIIAGIAAIAKGASDDRPAPRPALHESLQAGTPAVLDSARRRRRARQLNSHNFRCETWPSAPCATGGSTASVRCRSMPFVKRDSRYVTRWRTSPSCDTA